jgi:hypothetical protein
MSTRRSPTAPQEPGSSAPRPRTRSRHVAEAPPPPAVDSMARHAMIAEAAYLRAELRGFAPGHETEDWIAAEAEVDALLKDHGGSPQ